MVSWVLGAVVFLVVVGVVVAAITVVLARDGDHGDL